MKTNLTDILKRPKLIAAGKLWQVHSGAGHTAELLKEGSKTACIKFMREKRIYRDWRKGKGISFGKLIWEETK